MVGCKTYWKIILAMAVAGRLAAPALADRANCDNNAVMYCGAFSKADFDAKLNGGDGHNSDLAAVYAAHGITRADMDSADTQDGEVHKDGTVWVGGQMVASGALSTGRVPLPGSTRDGSLWMRPPAVSFLQDSLQAFVDMRGGTFQWAVIKACGNPVRATPVQPQVAPPPPAPPPPTPPPPPPTPTPLPPPPAPAPPPVPITPRSGPGNDLPGAAGGAVVGFVASLHKRSRQAIRWALLRGK